jgi:hypothetical protein
MQVLFDSSLRGKRAAAPVDRDFVLDRIPAVEPAGPRPSNRDFSSHSRPGARLNANCRIPFSFCL